MICWIVRPTAVAVNLMDGASNLARPIAPHTLYPFPLAPHVAAATAYRATHLDGVLANVHASSGVAK